MKHQYLFELGGENTELGKIEAIELLSTENYEPVIAFDERTIIAINVSKVIKSKIVRRLGMTKRVSKIFYKNKETNLELIVKEMPQIDIGQNTFAIRQISKKKMSILFYLGGFIIILSIIINSILKKKYKKKQR